MVEVFTDGSTIYHNGKVVGYGMGIFFPDTNVTITGYGSRYQTSHQIAGECLAVLVALNYCHAHHITNVTIKYDYLDVAKWALRQWRTKTPVSQMYVRYYDKLSQGLAINFVKVKAHHHIAGNERADNLAHYHHHDKGAINLDNYFKH